MSAPTQQLDPYTLRRIAAHMREAVETGAGASAETRRVVNGFADSLEEGADKFDKINQLAAGQLGKAVAS